MNTLRTRFGLYQRGFSLLEMIVVIVVLALAATGVIIVTTNIFSGQQANQAIEIGTALMQECAEEVLSVRKTQGYAAVNATYFTTNKCGAMGAFTSGGVTYSVPSVTLTAITTTDRADCPANCKLVTISQGSITPSLTLLLVNY